jgi:hypothetical protein
VYQLAVLCAAIFLSFNVLASPKPPAPRQSFANCLPAGITASDVVSARFVRSRNTIEKTTVEQKLVEIKAKCKSGRIVDSKGKEVRFFRLQGCWGNPPVGYQEILEEQNKQLEKLKKRYTVIEMTCNPEGAPIH